MNGAAEAAGTTGDIVLGGNIVLSGFRELDGPSMSILKKIIGNYARQFSEKYENFERIHITLKQFQELGGVKKFEARTELSHGGQSETGLAIDANLFIAVDSALKKVEKI